MSDEANSAMPILDRSRSQLRLPIDIVPETLRLAHVETLSEEARRSLEPDPPDSGTVARLEDAGILHEGALDPMAAELLRIVNNASLTVNIDLRYGNDASVPSIWATPRQGVVGNSIDPAFVEYRPVQVANLPYLLADLVVLRSPTFVAPSPIALRTAVLAEAESLVDDHDEAFRVLTTGGLVPDHAELIMAFQGQDIRRWRISSSWSTDDGKDASELRGLDAGPAGQWLVSMTGSSSNGQLTFEPQGHGDIMRAFRSVMPRNWVGTPLTPPKH